MFGYERSDDGGSGPHLFSCIHWDHLADSEHEGVRWQSTFGGLRVPRLTLSTS